MSANVNVNGYASLGGGYATRTILWHALNEGVVSSETLVRLSGVCVVVLRDALRRMQLRGLIAPVPRALRLSADSRCVSHGLTPKGIEVALLVDIARVQMAEPELPELSGAAA